MAEPFAALHARIVADVELLAAHVLRCDPASPARAGAGPTARRTLAELVRLGLAIAQDADGARVAEMPPGRVSALRAIVGLHAADALVALYDAP